MGQALLQAGVAIAPAAILIVDDSETARAVYKRLLLRRGYEVLEAEDGAGALERVEADHPDLVLLDLRLPDIDGAEVLRQLRANYDSAALPIVMVSGEHDGEVAAACVNLGADEFLVKPVFPAVLYARISTFIATASARAEAQRSRAPFGRPQQAIFDAGAGEAS